MNITRPHQKILPNAALPIGNNMSKNIVLNTDNDVVQPLDSIVIYEHSYENVPSKRLLTLNLVGTTPVHLKGWELVKNRELMTIGISPGNGYFSKDRLEVILMGVASYFAEVVVIVPDLPALHTYRALGYDEHRAVERMKKHRQEINRCCRRASEQVLLNFGKNNIRLLTWSDGFSEEDDYQQSYERAVKLFQNNPEFQESILRNTERYILARLEEQNVQQLGGMRKIVEKAAYYLIEEMALHEVLQKLLGKEPIISYYRDLELVSNYVNGKYDNPKNDHIGWVVYNIIDGE